MKKPRDGEARTRELRRRAEKSLTKREAAARAISEADMRKLVHELQVHQIELEMVNEELAISEERARQAIEASHAAIWDYDVTTGEVYLSEDWAVFLGGSREPTYTSAQALMALVPEEERQGVQEATDRVISVGGPSQFRLLYSVRRPDGDLIWLRSFGKVIARDRHGRALRIIGMNLDVTAHMRLENELREREARYRAVIETAADGFLVVDRKGRLLETNEAYARQSGYTREALIGMHIADLEFRENAEETVAHIDRVVAQGHDRFESMHRRRDGSVWPVVITASHWAELDRIFAFVTDISERKSMEDKLASIRKTMGELQKQQVAAQTAMAIAHEINQPLQAVATYGEVSLSILNSGIKNMDKLRTAVEGSAQQAKRAGRAIAQMIEMLSADQTETEAIDLNEELRHIVALAKSEHGLNFTAVFHLAKAAPMVQVNRLHVQKALLNLIQNSVDSMATAGGASPVITVDVRAEREAGMAQITLRDTGPGFKLENLEQLFRPFSIAKNGGMGMGMGLIISRSLIEANGGQLWIDPEKAPGATVHLTLPFAVAD